MGFLKGSVKDDLSLFTVSKTKTVCPDRNTPAATLLVVSPKMPGGHSINSSRTFRLQNVTLNFWRICETLVFPKSIPP